MKLAKRVLALALAAFITAGMFAPLATEAATIRGGLHFITWNSLSSVTLSTPKQNADRYQYKVYYNSGRLKATSTVRKLDSTDVNHFIDIYGLPTHTCCYVSVRLRRSGVWTAWSSKFPLMPEYSMSCLPVKEVIDNKARTCTISWKRFTGATHYDLYINTSGNTWKRVKTFYTGETTRYTFRNWGGVRFKDNKYYTYIIIGRKLVNGKWVRSATTNRGPVSGSFGFNIIPSE